MVSDVEQWLQACKGILSNDGSQPFLYPHFPGFNAEHPFQCELVFGDPWSESFRAADVAQALEPTNYFERVERVIDLYVRGIEILAQRDPRPDVTICAIPQEVVDYCTVREVKPGEKKRVKVSRAERKARQIAGSGQLSLLPEMDPTLGIEDEEWGHQNLRRGLKAEAMQF